MLNVEWNIWKEHSTRNFTINIAENMFQSTFLKLRTVFESSNLIFAGNGIASALDVSVCFGLTLGRRVARPKTRNYNRLKLKTGI